MEKKTEKRKLSERPILFGMVCLLLTDLCSYILGTVITLLAAPMLRRVGIINATDLKIQAQQVSNIIYIITPILAIIVMYVFYRKNQKNDYKGVINVRGENCLDVWICIGIFVVAFIARFFHGLMTTPDGFNKLHFGLSALPLHICAGIAEEIVYRGIPVAVMMRNMPDSKRIRRVFIVTSILFSLMHLVNGYGAGNTIVQLIATFIMGMFWGAIYLRTGSILITIVFHFLYDVFVNMMVLPDPIQTSNIVFLIFVQLLPIVLTIVIMRKSKMEEIKKTWANIWSEKI